jgi:hypothetical protein
MTLTGDTMIGRALVVVVGAFDGLGEGIVGFDGVVE